MAEHSSLRSLRVLIVDDCHDTVDSLASLLVHWGHQPLTAFSGEEALIRVQEGKPHVILLDIGLPKMDGWEVARRLHFSQGAGWPLVIAVSGYGREEDKDISWRAGCHLHLTKPVDPEILRHLLCQLRHGEDE